MSSAQEDLRLAQWYNVYGWKDSCVEEAAANDESLRRLIEIEEAIGPLDEEASAIRSQITRLEPCHPRCRENVEDIVRMIGAMTPARILGCGQPDPALVDQLRGIAAGVAAWADGDDEASGVWADVLGEGNPQKRWLVACLCKTLATQFEGHDGGRPLRQPRLDDQIR